MTTLVLALSPTPAQAADGGLSGTVTRASDGQPVEGICVAVTRDDGFRVSSVTTDSGGGWVLSGLAPAPDYHLLFDDCRSEATLLAEWFDGASSFVDAADVEVVSGTTTTGVDAALATGGRLSGTVVLDADGTPLGDVCVTAEADDGAHADTDRSAADGAWAIGGLPDGMYRVSFTDCMTSARVGREWYDDQPSPGQATLVGIGGPHPSNQSLGTTRMGPPGVVAGTVRDLGGNTLDGICVSAYWADDILTGVSTGPVMTDTTSDGGQYQARGLGPGDYLVDFHDCTEGLYLPEWIGDTRDPASAEVLHIGDQGGLHLREAELTLGGRVSGTVRDAMGVAVPGICVLFIDGDVRVRWATITGGDGTYSTGALPSDAYAVWFTDCNDPWTWASQWWDGSQGTAGASALVVPVGEPVVADARLGFASDLTGRVTDEVTGAGIGEICVVVVDAPGSLVEFATTNTEGYFQVTGIPIGDFKVRFLDCADEERYGAEYFQDAATFDEAAWLSFDVGPTGGRGVNAQLQDLRTPDPSPPPSPSPSPSPSPDPGSDDPTNPGPGIEMALRVLGGTAVISSDVQQQIETLTGADALRLAGTNRYATAAAIVADAFPDPVSTVYVATGQQFPDALSGAAAAAADGAPILLVGYDHLPEAVEAQLRRLAPDVVKVLGGPAAVSGEVIAAIETATGVAPVRLAGTDRFETAAAVVAHAFPDPVATVYVATGEAFPDALAGSAAAAKVDGPVLLVRRDRVPEAIADQLQRLAPTQIKVLGGPVAVADEVLDELATLSGVAPTRVFGPDRYATAAAVVSDAFEAPAAALFVATGEAFPDALAGSAAAAALDGPVLLVRRDLVPEPVADELRRLRP